MEYIEKKEDCENYYTVEYNEEKLDSLENYLSQEEFKQYDKLKKIASESIIEAQKYVREKNDISSVSLREIRRFSIFYNFFVGHSFLIPQWDFAIGEGSDILQALNYYVIGDPFAFFSFLFPSHLMYIYYSEMCIVRIYCAGLAFIYLCKGLGHSDKTPILAGAFMYAFCYWAFYNCARHPYFINPLVWFPLIIAGVEKIIQGKQPFFIYFL